MVPAFAKEAAEKAVSDFREMIAVPRPGFYEMTTAIHPRDLAARPSPAREVREIIDRNVRSLVFDMISKGGSIPGCPQLALREGEKHSIHEGLLLLSIRAPTVAQSDDAHRELTKALATLLPYFGTEFEAVRAEAMKALLQHGHPAEIPDRMKPRSPHG